MARSFCGTYGDSCRQHSRVKHDREKVRSCKIRYGQQALPMSHVTKLTIPFNEITGSFKELWTHFKPLYNFLYFFSTFEQFFFHHCIWLCELLENFLSPRTVRKVYFYYSLFSQSFHHVFWRCYNVLYACYVYIASWYRACGWVKLLTSADFFRCLQHHLTNLSCTIILLLLLLLCC